jgi:transcriptional regulator with XRE-family HTH domain
MAGTVRTAKKLMLGREIAHMMSVADVTQQQVALILETSPSRVAILLNGGGAIAVGDLERVANRLGFTEAGYLTALNELRRDNHKRGFWTTGYNRAYSEDIRLRIDIERHADQIRATHTEVVPGLLQTENYIRAMYADQPSDIEGLTSEEAVQARLARQEILDKSDPPQLHIILSESCIRRMWAPDEVMREQIQHLIKLSKRPRIMLQLLPYRMPPGSRAPIGTRFTLLRAPSPGVAGPLELCYIEGEGEIRYLDEKKTLIAYDTAWTRLTAAALGFAESRKFLTRVLDETP